MQEFIIGQGSNSTPNFRVGSTYSSKSKVTNMQGAGIAAKEIKMYASQTLFLKDVKIESTHDVKLSNEAIICALDCTITIEDGSLLCANDDSFTEFHECNIELMKDCAFISHNDL